MESIERGTDAKATGLNDPLVGSILAYVKADEGADAKVTGLNSPSDLGILLFNDVAGQFYAKAIWFDGPSEDASLAAFKVYSKISFLSRRE